MYSGGWDVGRVRRAAVPRICSCSGRWPSSDDLLGPPGDLGRGEGTVSEKLRCLESVGEAEGEHPGPGLNAPAGFPESRRGILET